MFMSQPTLVEMTRQQTVKSNLQEALKAASGPGSEADKMEALVEADVYEALQHALAK